VVSQRPKLEMRKGIETMQGSEIQMRIGQFRNFSLIDLLIGNTKVNYNYS
jgi:hypothetical protein